MSPTAERSALLQSAAHIATSLISLANNHQPLPTSFSNTPQGVLIGEPSGVVLGPLSYGNTVEWGTDAHGQVTVLTLIGATFQTRVPLDVGAIPLAPGTNA